MNSALVILIFLHLNRTAKKVKENAIKNRMTEKINGVDSFKEFLTSSNVIPQMNVVKIRPIIAKEYVLKIIFFLIHLNYEAQQQYHTRLLTRL